MNEVVKKFLRSKSYFITPPIKDYSYFGMNS
jgi:hypothetical protein